MPRVAPYLVLVVTRRSNI